MTYANNPAFKPILTAKASGVTFYSLKDITTLSTARKVALDAQSIFADGIISLPLLKALATAAIKDLDEKKSVTNQGVFWNNILYRCSYPVDEDVSLRASACVVFLEGEDQQQSFNHDIDKKVKLMKEDSEAYAFFLAMGIALVPAYKPYAGESSKTYFQNRKQSLQALTPQQ